jgi:hypothetical protein
LIPRKEVTAPTIVPLVQLYLFTVNQKLDTHSDHLKAMTELEK